MGIELVYRDPDKLKSIEELAETDIEISTEGMSVKPKQQEINNNCDSNNDTNIPIKFFPTVNRTPKSDKTYTWKFTLPETWFETYGGFVIAMSEVGPEDDVYIVGPEACSSNNASTVVSSILACKSKNIHIQIPFINGLGSLYILSYATKIIYSPYDFMICSMDNIYSGGKIWDNKATIAMHDVSNKLITDRLIKTKLLTQEECDHILNAQGQVACYCQDLANRFKAFNEMKK